MTQALQLVVDATTQSAEARFSALTRRAQETGDASVRSAADVASAADKVLQAQAKQADAAGQVQVAEKRLQELREKGTASASQLEAAEQKLESAKRRLHLASRDVVNAQGQEESAVRQATDAVEDGERASDGYGDALGDLKGKLAGLAAGYVGVEGLRSLVTGFADGARNAGLLSRALNSTVGEAGQVARLVESVGLEAKDTLGIIDTFQQTVAATPDVLDDLGISLKRNRDGTINYAASLKDTLAALQRIPDSTKRTALAYQLLSDEGAEYLANIYNGTTDVADAFDALGVPFDEEDVAAAAEYDTALQNMKITTGDLATAAGRELLPVVTAVVGGIKDVVDVVSSVPTPMLTAAAAVGGLAAAKHNLGVEGSFLDTVLENVQGGLGRVRGAFAGPEEGASRLSRTMGAARVAGGGLLGLLGGPMGVAVLGLGAAFTLLNNRTNANGVSAEEAAAANEDLAGALQQSNGVVTESVRRQAALSAQQAGLLDVAERAGVAQGDVTEALLGNEAAYDRVTQALQDYQDLNSYENNYGTTVLKAEGHAAEDARESLDDLRGTVDENSESQQQLAGELDETTDKQALATAATEALTAALDAGNVSTSDLVRLAGDAVAAQDAAAAADNRAQAAMDAYRATTSQAVQATLELINARYASENAGFAFLQAVDNLKSATDDATTSVDEHRQAQVQLMQAALGAASAAADAAVQNAEATGQVVDDVAEAQIRADAMLTDLRGRLNTPGLTRGARDELQGVIDQLQTAKDRGDIEAVLTLTGAQQAQGELDETTEDRDTTIRVESRNGPAVERYLDGIASANRLAIVRVESRGGPDVDRYLDGLRGSDRLAIIRVESRNGPAVNDYLWSIANQYRLAIINVESRGGPEVDNYLDGLANQRRVAVIDVQRTGSGAPSRPTGAPALMGAGLYGDPAVNVTVQSLTVQAETDGAGRATPGSKAELGRQYVEALGAYTKRNGAGWLKGLQR